jgi:metal-responsive CopG/Arc/MetJ family transcriptional regulator
MSTSTRIHILLPEDTLSRLDAQRGLVPRSSYIRALIAQSLDVEEDIKGLREQPLMEETPAKVIKVVPASKPGVECVHTWAPGSIFDRCVKCEETRRH